jgi:hypothetical protein
MLRWYLYLFIRSRPSCRRHAYRGRRVLAGVGKLPVDQFVGVMVDVAAGPTPAGVTAATENLYLFPGTRSPNTCTIRPPALATISSRSPETVYFCPVELVTMYLSNG